MNILIYGTGAGVSPAYGLNRDAPYAGMTCKAVNQREQTTSRWSGA